MLFAMLNKKRLVLAVMLPFSAMAGRDGRSSYANGQRRMLVSKMPPKASAQKYTDLSDLRIGFLKPGIVTTLLLLNMVGPHLANAMPSTETLVGNKCESKPIAQDEVEFSRESLNAIIKKCTPDHQYAIEKLDLNNKASGYLTKVNSMSDYENVGTYLRALEKDLRTIRTVKILAVPLAVHLAAYDAKQKSGFTFQKWEFDSIVKCMLSDKPGAVEYLEDSDIFCKEGDFKCDFRPTV